MQIDLHSLDADYFDWFTNSTRNLNRVKQNIINLVNAGVSVRVASIITRRNLHEIGALAEWCNDHNVRLFMPSIVVPLGRAAEENTEADLYLDEEEILLFNQELENAKQLYPDLFLENVSAAKQINCGALVSHISINSKGDIKLCNMDTMDCFKLPLDNVLQVPLKETLEKNKAFIDALFKAEAPDPNSLFCMDCAYRAECGFCLLRSLRYYSFLGDKCKWYNYHKPEVLNYITMEVGNEELI